MNSLPQQAGFINLDGTLITDDTTYNVGAMKVFRTIGNTQFYNLCRVEECGAAKDYEHMLFASSITAMFPLRVCLASL